MILCCGEALIDMIPTPTPLGRDGFVPHSGGAVFNTAIALGRLGAQTGMFTGLSSDIFGQQLLAGLKASRVDVKPVVVSDRPSTLAFVHLTDGHATYDFYDENSAGRILEPKDIPDLGDEVSTLFFGGISLASEPCADTYAALLDQEKGRRLVMLDPNIRPDFIQDAQRFRVRLNGMIAGTDILKVSDEDLNWIVPTSQSLAEKLDVLLGMGPSLVIMTRGGDGATGYLKNKTEVSVPAVKVDIVDTVGAGDTFNAGVMAKLSELGCLGKSGLNTLNQEALAFALEHGAKVAAIVVSRAGANPPWAEEI